MSSGFCLLSLTQWTQEIKSNDTVLNFYIETSRSGILVCKKTQQGKENDTLSPQCWLNYLSYQWSILASAFISISGRNAVLCICILNLAKHKCQATEGPPVSHRFSKAPAQPSIWNIHCPVKGTEQSAQACSYLSVHVLGNRPQAVANEHGLLHTDAHTPVQTGDGTSCCSHDMDTAWMSYYYYKWFKKFQFFYFYSTQALPEFCWDTVWYTEGRMTVCVQFSTFVRLVVSSLLHDIHRCAEPLSQSVLYSTFPLPVASAIALLMQPHGHNRGIMGAST